jgi:SAM-dependent methyltransferase
MDEASLRQALQAISGKDLSLRKAWYSPVAEAYQATRPSYPSALVGRAVSAAKLSSSSRILELGCGPGTATVPFAALGCSMVCLEPNSDFCAMAKVKCTSYPSVQVINQSFEEWDLEPEAFDAVLAASSIHWIPAEIAYAKASRALKPDGHLILLWNKEPQPSAAIQAALSEVYQRHAPALGHTEDRATQERILSGLGQMMLDSGRFHNLVAATVECSLTTTPDQYIDLLATYSPYHKLDPRVRSAMFSELKQCLVEQGVGELQLSYLSAVHIAQRMPSFGQ